MITHIKPSYSQHLASLAATNQSYSDDSIPLAVIMDLLVENTQSSTVSTNPPNRTKFSHKNTKSRENESSSPPPRRGPQQVKTRLLLTSSLAASVPLKEDRGRWGFRRFRSHVLHSKISASVPPLPGI